MLKASGVRVEYTYSSDKVTSLKEWIVRTATRRDAARRKIVALDGVDLEVSPGDCFGLIGHNGSGKSTLLKVLSGVLTPCSGAVEYQGRMTSLIELGAGFDPELTGLENIRLNCALIGLSPLETQDATPGIIEFSELGEYINQPVKNYSSGMQARLGFSCATAVNPDIMLIDEALAVGDELFQKKCLQHLESLRRQGRIVVLVSHDLNAIEKYCNRVCLLNRGKVQFQGQAREGVEIFRSHLLRALAEGRTMVGASIQDTQESSTNQTEQVGYGAEEGPLSIAEVERKRALFEVASSLEGMVHTERLNLLEFGRPWRASFYVDQGKLDSFIAKGGSNSFEVRIEICEGRAGLRMASWKTAMAFGELESRQPSPGKAEYPLLFETCPLMPGRYVMDVEISSQSCALPPARIQHLVSFEVLPTGAEAANEGSLVPLGIFHAGH